MTMVRFLIKKMEKHLLKKKKKKKTHKERTEPLTFLSLYHKKEVTENTWPPGCVVLC